MTVDLRRWGAAGESETQEWKRSTAELRRAGATHCAFLSGGRVLIGVPPRGQMSGQDVADSTLRDIAAILGRFEPPARIEMSRVPLANGREMIALEAPAVRDSAPFVLEGRAYQRVGSTNTAMPQAEHVPSEYSEQVGVVTVSFRGAIAKGLPRKDPGSTPGVTQEVTPEVARHILAHLEELSCKDLRAAMASGTLSTSARTTCCRPWRPGWWR